MTINSTKRKLNWSATGDERRAQNAANLLNIGYYENAFERTMGNKSLGVPETEPDEISEEIYRNFATFIPKAEIMDVRITVDHDGDAALEVDISHE